MRSVLGVAMAAVVVLAGGCASTHRAGPFDVPAQEAGTGFVRETRDSGSYGSTTHRGSYTRLAKRQWQGVDVFPYRMPGEAQLLQDAQGAFRAVIVKGAVATLYDPPGTYDWPLEVGKKWSRATTLAHPGRNATTKMEEQFTVEAYEDVVVLAGTFKAFRVRSTDNHGNDNLNWYSPELGIWVRQHLVRSATHASGPGVRDTEVVSQTIVRR